MVTRRQFLTVAAGMVSAALLSACGGTASVASTPPSSAAAKPSTAPPASSAPGSAVASAASAAPKPSASVAASAAASAGPKPNAALPTYIPLATRPKPDYPSDGPLYEDGYDNYPKNPQKSWTKDPPGTGSNVLATSSGLYPPSNSIDKNQAWQAVNKALNANVSFNIVPQQDYTTRMATMMAGGDLPDFLMINFNTTNGAAQFVQAQCADLTPYLGGDAIKDYPNLAAIPTFAWVNSGAVVNGKLYLVPIERYAPGGFLFKNDRIYDQEIGKDYKPKNWDDYKRVLQQLNKPSENRYATSTYAGTGYDCVAYSAYFGAPNMWRLDSSGKLTRAYETPEFKATVAALLDLNKTGVLSPKGLNYNLNSRRADFAAGRLVILPEGFGNPWNDFWTQGLGQNPPNSFHPIAPFAAMDGGKPQHFLSTGNLGGNVLKKGSPDRVKELLRIMDWLAAPFGTQEDLLLTAGIPGVDYNLDDNGNPKPIGNNLNLDANYVNWKYIVQHPQVMYNPTIPGYAKSEYDAEHLAIPVGVSDPTLGFFSPTNSSKNAALNQAFLDGVTDIVAGRGRSMNDYDQLVKDWQNNGGEQIRKEYSDAIASSK